MKSLRLPNLFVALGTAGLLLPQFCQAIDLGDAAPPLDIKNWVKGEAVDLSAGKDKNIYVVEFWATWCGPCRTSIPHLSEMQATYKKDNVVIIGVSDETVSKVKPFVGKMGDQMDYTVAVDNDRATFNAYMKAFGVGGIPHAFVINKKGELVWHGHPMAGLDKVLDKVIAGKFDVEAAKLAAQVEKLVPEYLTAVATDKPTPEVIGWGKKIVQDGGDNPELMNQFAWIILTHPRIQHRDLELASAAAQKAYDATEGKDPAVIDTYARALFDSGKKEQAIKLQKQAIKICTEEDLKKGLQNTLERYEKESQ